MVVAIVVPCLMGFDGAAMAFGAKNVKTYDAQGNPLTRYQLSVKKESARTKSK
jgi:hypothetical protein